MLLCAHTYPVKTNPECVRVCVVLAMLAFYPVFQHTLPLQPGCTLALGPWTTPTICQTALGNKGHCFHSTAAPQQHGTKPLSPHGLGSVRVDALQVSVDQV
jgi:hypothetical protein